MATESRRRTRLTSATPALGMVDMAMQIDDIEAAVRAVIADRLPAAKIVKVAVRSDIDSDDDDGIIRVVVVLEDAPSKLDKRALLGFVRHLRTRLEEVHREEFPILSFVSKNDAKQLDIEAA